VCKVKFVLAEIGGESDWVNVAQNRLNSRQL